MTIAVIGGTGLVGRHIVEALAGGCQHRIVATYHLRQPYEAARTGWVRCDLRDADQALKALDGVDTAVVCAGQLSTSAVLKRDPTGSVLSTLRIVTNVLEAAARLHLRRIVLISSCTTYPALGDPAVEADMATGDPPSQWFGVGWMHRYLEHQLRWYVEHLKLIGSAVALRPSLIFGPHDDFSPETGHFVPVLIRKVVERERPILIWGDGEQTRNLVHASDVAEAILAVLDGGSAPFEAFNVVSPGQASVNEVARHLIELDGFSDAILLRDAGQGRGPRALQVSGAAFVAATGWKPKFDLRDGLADTLSWFRRTSG